LPPKAYLEHLIYFLIEKKKYRNWTCWIPQSVLSVHGDGNLNICTEISKENKPWGNIFNKKNRCFQDLTINHLLKNRNNLLPHCRGCYAHYEILNLFLNGYIQFEELSKMWFYRGKRVNPLLHGVNNNE
jgi:hypothetical protein